MAYTFDKANAAAPSKRKTQYFEMFANRGIYHDGWYAATTPPAPPWSMGLAKMPPIDQYNWELYHLTEDYSQANDLAAKNPDKLAELKKVFEAEAAKFQVFPLDNTAIQRMFSAKPSATAGRDVFSFSGEVVGIPTSGSPNILNRSHYSITAEVEIPAGGAEGMIVTEGGRFGGWGLYLLKGKPVYLYNLMFVKRFRWAGSDALSPGRHTIVFDFKSAGPGLGKGGTGVLSVDGKQVATQTIPATTPFLFPWDETFDVGVDTRTPVDDRDYQVPFRFTGKLDKLTMKLGPVILSEAATKQAAQVNHDVQSSR
jgi:arylsulfatase